MVRYTDYLVGKVIKELDELEIRQRTIVFFSTDNGTSRGITGHLKGRAVKGGKGTDTVRGVREPFLVNGPGVVPGGVVTDALTDFTDLFPTFVELAGAKMPDDVTIDGTSIAKVLLGEDKQGPREWVMAMGHSPAALDEQGVRPVEDYAVRQIRDKEYKIVVGTDRRVHALYNMEADPWEDHNLIDSDQPADLVALERLIALIGNFPEHDARPRYDPLPPQPWDRKREGR
jgi:arylsulfatase A-like enzyme